MKFDLIPHSNATTSWGLLEDVIKTIDQEPRRFDWGTWIDTKADYKGDDAPACGTTACIAGWTVLLTAQERGALEGFASSNTRARQWFPVSVDRDLTNLFLGCEDYAGPLGYRPGETRTEYVARGIAAIRKFMWKHEEALRAHIIHIPSRADARGEAQPAQGGGDTY